MDDVPDESIHDNILQCDGANSTILSSKSNTSVYSVSSYNSSVSQNQPIPVITSIPRNAIRTQDVPPRVLRTVNRNEKMMESATMPVIAVANCRSIEPKIKSVIEKIENELIDLLMVVEVWEKVGKKNKHFQNKIAEMVEMKGLKYISCGARPSGKRGGGAGIIVNLKKFSLDVLEINVPHNLEVKWGIMRPKKIESNSKYSVFLICSFYSPPASKKHRKLLDHLVSTIHALLAKYPKAAVILGADKNALPLAPLLQALPRFRQIVTQPTHGNKTIDVIIMNCADMYAVPQVGAPVLPDNPRQAKPSDHKVPVARPLATAARAVSNEYTVKTYRPLPESAVREFQAWIHAEEWGELALHSSPSGQVEAFQKIVDTKVEQLFPERKVRLSNQDKQFITSEIKTLDRKKEKRMEETWEVS